MWDRLLANCNFISVNFIHQISSLFPDFCLYFLHSCNQVLSYFQRIFFPQNVVLIDELKAQNKTNKNKELNQKVNYSYMGRFPSAVPQKKSKLSAGRERVKGREGQRSQWRWNAADYL